MISREDIPAAISATWPPEAVDHIGAFVLGEGAGGGNRVSAAQLRDTASDGGTVTPDDIARVAARQSARGDERSSWLAGQDAL